MVRARDVKGRYISINKNPEDIFCLRKIPHINYVDHYIGSSSRVAKVSTCWQSKLHQPAIVENPKKKQEEATSEPIDPTTNQEVNLEVVHQFLNQATNTVLQPVEAGIVVDNFIENIVKDPSDSGWDTTPTASDIKFLGGMADEE